MYSLDWDEPEIDDIAIYAELHDMAGFSAYRDEVCNCTSDGNSDALIARQANMIERLKLYVCHDAGCAANDLDPLDKTQCTCGLRAALNGGADV